MNLKRIDKNPINIHDNEILLFSCIRNEEKRIPYFLEYHRKLGIKHFFFIDNNSTDHSQELLISQGDSYVFFTDDSYADSNYGLEWIHELLSTFAIGHWTLTLDADELFVFPYIEQINLSQFIEYLEKTNADTVESFLLDMYADQPISETICQAGKPFLDICPYFDGDTYKFKKRFFRKKSRVPIRGGVRKRLFWDGYKREKPSPFLKKYPLVKWNKHHRFKASTHILENSNVTDITGVLLHFKLFSDFYDYVFRESKRNEHWDNAAQYKIYRKILADNEKLNPFYEGSLRYESSRQLIELGFMHVSHKYKKFNKSQGLI